MSEPGDIITPQSKPDESVEVTIPRETEPAVVKTPEQTPSSPEPIHPLPDESNQQPEPSPWQYSQESPDQPSPTDLNPIEWTASEFVDNEKDTSWFMGLGVLTGLAVGVIYLITREFITVIVILMAAGLFGVTAKRKPKTLNYHMDHSGISIGDKFYAYDGFKSFSVLEEGAFSSIQLTPLKRLAIPLSLYYPPEDEDRVVSMLANFLPHEVRTHDPVDRLMRKVRF